MNSTNNPDSLREESLMYAIYDTITDRTVRVFSSRARVWRFLLSHDTDWLASRGYALRCI